MRNQKLKNGLSDLTFGVITTAADLTLFFIYLVPNLLGATNSYKTRKAFEDTFDEVENLGLTKESLKKTFYNLTHKRLVLKPNKDKLYWQITEEGQKKIKSFLPIYQEKRTWDKKLYLIIYDIPESKKHSRETLREYMKKIGCGKLQESVWLTPFNPTGILRDFIKANSLDLSVIVSTIGADSSIGEESISDLVTRIYHLEEINDEYRQFIEDCNNGKCKNTEIIFKFLSILNHDPQLPFELLPHNWQGTFAHQLFSKTF